MKLVWWDSNISTKISRGGRGGNIQCVRTPPLVFLADSRLLPPFSLTLFIWLECWSSGACSAAWVSVDPKCHQTQHCHGNHCWFQPRSISRTLSDHTIVFVLPRGCRINNVSKLLKHGEEFFLYFPPRSIACVYMTVLTVRVCLFLVFDTGRWQYQFSVIRLVAGGCFLRILSTDTYLRPIE